MLLSTSKTLEDFIKIMSDYLSVYMQRKLDYHS